MTVEEEWSEIDRKRRLEEITNCVCAEVVRKIIRVPRLSAYEQALRELDEQFPGIRPSGSLQWGEGRAAYIRQQEEDRHD